MKKYGILILLFLGACGMEPDWTLRSLSQEQPSVIQMAPEDSFIAPTTQFKLVFSQAVSADSLSERAVLLTEGSVSFESYGSMKKLLDAIDHGDLKSIDIERALDEENIRLSVSPRQGTLAPQEYSLIVTSALMTEEKIPFSQLPAEGAVPFIRVFQVFNSENNDETIADAELPIPSTGASSSPSAAAPIAVREAPLVLLNEIYYDAPGSDTDGVLFVELIGEPGEDLSDVQICFVNGDNGAITDSIVIPSGTVIDETGLFVIADQSSSPEGGSHVLAYNIIDNFDPQNGPDGVQLIYNGELLDAVSYGTTTVTTAENGLSFVEGEAAPQVTSGHSISRVEGLMDTEDNKTDFIDNATPSPKSLAIILSNP